MTILIQILDLRNERPSMLLAVLNSRDISQLKQFLDTIGSMLIILGGWNDHTYGSRLISV